MVDLLSLVKHIFPKWPKAWQFFVVTLPIAITVTWVVVDRLYQAQITGLESSNQALRDKSDRLTSDLHARDAELEKLQRTLGSAKIASQEHASKPIEATSGNPCLEILAGSDNNTFDGVDLQNCGGVKLDQSKDNQIFDLSVANRPN